MLAATAIIAVLVGYDGGTCRLSNALPPSRWWASGPCESGAVRPRWGFPAVSGLGGGQLRSGTGIGAVSGRGRGFRLSAASAEAA